MKVYLKNIKQTTSYLYTENQYFRWPTLVEEFFSSLENNATRSSRTNHWFVVTNSSDGGIGDGTFNTNSMLKLLGRQDVMPNVARNVRLEELEAEKREYLLTNIRGTLGIPAPLDRDHRSTT